MLCFTHGTQQTEHAADSCLCPLTKHQCSAMHKLSCKYNSTVMQHTEQPFIQRLKHFCITSSSCISQLCSAVVAKGWSPLDEGALANGDWSHHLVLPHFDSNHCQQALCCYVSLRWPASSHAFCTTLRSEFTSSSKHGATSRRCEAQRQGLLDFVFVGTAIWTCRLLCIFVLHCIALQHEYV